MNEWMSEIVIELIHWIIELTRKGSQPCLGLLEKVLFRKSVFFFRKEASNFDEIPLIELIHWIIELTSRGT